MSTVVIAAASATSAGGLIALVVRKFHLLRRFLR
jgi:hypothetical protein